jgi:peptide/nickel transport system ATP-binding protein
MKLLEVQDLKVYYRTPQGPVRAVDGVSFSVEKGDYFGLVGESGCGKTTLSRAILRLLPPDCDIVSGGIYLNGRDLTAMSQRQLRSVRGREIAFVPQSAMNSLDPVMRVGDQIVEAIRAHKKVSRPEGLRQAAALFELVGLDPSRLNDYPHQFSGGMRQRALIGMAMALNPDLLVADEPTTALDVIVKDQILFRIDQIQRQLGKSLFLITHDISVVAENCDRTAVMYAGKIMEYGATDAVLTHPFHPYTLGLKNAFPTIDGPVHDLISIPGMPPDLAHPPSGCRFHPRCPMATARCQVEEPAVLEVQPGHLSACHYPERAPEFRELLTDMAVWERRREYQPIVEEFASSDANAWPSGDAPVSIGSSEPGTDRP